MSIEAMKQALEALENTTPTGFNMERDKQFFAAITSLRQAIAEAEKQEPVAICEYCEKERPVIHAQQREWVGLTDEEFLYCIELENPTAIAEEVEAKLKEKNT